MSVTLSEVKRAAKAHRAPLAGESAGYLVLAIADQVLSAPRLVETSDIQLTEDGGLRVLSGRASSDTDAELGLRRALDALLLVASSGSAALTRASRRTSPVGLSALVRELEAALIPVNRAAARRALARLHRETARAVSSGTLADEEPEIREVVPPAVVQKAPDPAPALAPAPALISAPAPVAEPEPEPDLETRAIRVAVEQVSVVSALPALSPELDAMLTALCVEPAEPPQFEESDALTSALAVRYPCACLNAGLARTGAGIRRRCRFRRAGVGVRRRTDGRARSRRAPVALSAHARATDEPQRSTCRSKRARALSRWCCANVASTRCRCRSASEFCCRRRPPWAVWPHNCRCWKPCSSPS